ncbi:MAG: ATP-dependent zinc metalloprotease FtsH [Acidimicrobiia bacterium]|nr:ATP-dependent zinc metalloprotease FtsH [Acidimicrobiia bacterium]
MADQGPPPPPPPPERGSRSSDPGWPRLAMWIVLGTLLAALVLSAVLPSDSADGIIYSDFQEAVEAGQVEKITINNETGKIKGTFVGGEDFTTTGPAEVTDDDLATYRENIDEVEVDRTEPSFLTTWLPLLLPISLLILFFWWMQRRAQGQMGGIMSIGRSRAKTYTTERPGTTFDDVAGYAGVKQEIREVVDFLKYPDRFGAIGARIPKGVLLVGPPGTGKTLIARAVAGEAGVPFLSVTGSDFMEMFVGVGASRVRDLFESARKLGRAIIFIDEIDSVGRKRGAGLGGGHDEREQTLNQMLAEMDGFEATEGIVMMAATNRPDILDPALLRPGRFDRQVVVPLPELDDRRAILDVHVKGKKLAASVDLNVVARGTPGMAGADLANLVNEAALFAVRSGADHIRSEDFEAARDRVLMGQTRESTVLSDAEKERVAYHEAGHAVCATVLPNADPLHKVSIVARGMALGVTMTLPAEDRYLWRHDFITDELVKLLGGRMAEQLVFGDTSSGAADDLNRATELTGKMVKEWGMSDRIGPMAWQSQQGQVFLGDEIVGQRAYSDETAKVIDSEIEAILREQEERCRQLLTNNRHGLDLVARSLLEHETIDGTEVRRLVDLGQDNTAAADQIEPEPSTVPGDAGPE